MDDKDTYLYELELELYELSSKIDAFKLYLADEESNAMDDSDIYILEEKEDEIQRKLEMLKAAEDDLWDERKEDIEVAMDEFRDAINNVFTI